MFDKKTLTALFGLVLAAAGTAGAQTTVTLPNESQTTTLTSNVSEQARVTVPGNVTFNVVNIASSTAASSASVTVDNIVLASATKQLKIFIRADDADFTPPVPGATTWAASDVSWNAATWTNGTGAALAPGSFNDAAFSEVATCDADAASCSTTGLVFTLAPKTSVQRSGNHTLDIIWKFESIGT